MEIAERKNEAFVVVAPSGRVDGVTAPELERRLTEIVERGDSRVLLDCENMSYISSAGLRVVLLAAKKCQQGSGKLILCSLQPDCKTAMEISGFLTMLDFYDDAEAAVAAES